MWKETVLIYFHAFCGHRTDKSQPAKSIFGATFKLWTTKQLAGEQNHSRAKFGPLNINNNAYKRKEFVGK
jgi:hypothetical protein